MLHVLTQVEQLDSVRVQFALLPTLRVLLHRMHDQEDARVLITKPAQEIEIRIRFRAANASVQSHGLASTGAALVVPSRSAEPAEPAGGVLPTCASLGNTSQFCAYFHT